MQCFYWSITPKSVIGMLLNMVHGQVQKKTTKTYSKGFPNHSTLISYDHWKFSSDMPHLFIDELLFKREKNARYVTSALCAVWTLNT